MEDSINNIEDQPKPEPTPTLQEAQATFQESINELGKQLMRKFQLNQNQFNVLELELRVFVLVEQVNLLTKMVQGGLGPMAPTDTDITRQMTAQIIQLSKTLEDELNKAPRIAMPNSNVPPNLNGPRRH